MTQRFFCLFGLSGAGKSSATRVVCQDLREHGLDVSVQKLAEPLYVLQGHFYRTAGVPIDHYSQDQILLEDIANHLRRISPKSIVADFVSRVKGDNASTIVNDDLRDLAVDYPVLRELGFKFIRIECDEGVRLQRLGKRRDLQTNPGSRVGARLGEIQPDAVIENNGEMAAFEENVKRALWSLM